jgi:hypothetical protein
LDPRVTRFAWTGLLAGLLAGNSSRYLGLESTMSHQLNADNSPAVRTVEQVYREWDEALGAKNVDAAVALYAPEVTIDIC